MAKIHPQTLSSPPPSTTSSSCASTSTSCSNYVSFEREMFTVWLKSLVYQGNGCTVFDSKGRLVYRVDNYDKKCSKQVYLMDIRGKVLFSIQQKKLRFLGQWNGYKWSDCGLEKAQVCFRVRKDGIFDGFMNCQVFFGCDHRARGNRYKIVRDMAGKLAFKIVDREGRVVAEVKPKQSSCGVSLGEDVLSLMVEPEVDHSLIMAIVTAYGSINHRL